MWILFLLSGSFGASSLKLSNLRLAPARSELANLQNGVRLRNSGRFDGVVLSQRSGKASSQCLCLPVKNAECKISCLFQFSFYFIVNSTSPIN